MARRPAMGRPPSAPSSRSRRSQRTALNSTSCDPSLARAKDGKARNMRSSHRLPCKSLSTEKHEFSLGALESALLVRSGSIAARVCFSADGSCSQAEPDIHLLPQAPKSYRRRLSLCSLPVPKQLEESLGSSLRRPGGNLRDLAACASIDPDIFPFLGRVFTLPAELFSALHSPQ
jgi:hypothetical protein